MLSIETEHAYAFIGGVVVTKIAGMIPAIIVSGILLYITDRSLFTIESLSNVKIALIEITKNITT